MSLRRRRTDHVSHERWLVSYADFVTLLFAFFVVLYASAQVDKDRALQLSDAIRSGFQQLGAFRGNISQAQGERAATDARNADARLARSENELPPNNAGEFSRIRRELERALAAQIERNEVALHMEPDGLVVTLREIGFFDSGSATMKPGAQQAFARVAAILRE